MRSPKKNQLSGEAVQCEREPRSTVDRYFFAVMKGGVVEDIQTVLALLAMERYSTRPKKVSIR